MTRYTPPVDPDITKSQMTPHERAIRSRAVQLLASSGLLHGFVVERERSCGRDSCWCARGDRKHPTVLVHRRKDGKLRQLYVSKAAEAAVRRWVEQDKELRALLEEIWEIHWQRAKARPPKKQGG
jgi:hypothetical protein